MSAILNILGLSNSRKRRDPAPDQDQRVVKLPTDLIQPNPMQPRKAFSDDALASLAESIRQYGILQPLVVRMMLSGEENTYPIYYELVAGERRLRAAILAGMSEVPCLIVETDSQTSAEMAIIENLQRENLDIFEQADAIKKLIEIYCVTQDEIARRLSVSQSYIANKLRLLKLTPVEQEAILRAGLSERHARALLRLSGDERLEALESVIRHSMNVAETEALVEQMLARSQEPPEPKQRPLRKLILKDTKIFVNTVERSVELVKQSGIGISYQKSETAEEYRMTITVRKRL